MRVFKSESGVVHMVDEDEHCSWNACRCKVAPHTQEDASPSAVTCGNCRRTVAYREAAAEMLRLTTTTKEVDVKVPAPQFSGDDNMAMSPEFPFRSVDVLDLRAGGVDGPSSDEDVRADTLLMHNGLVAAQWDAHERVGWICPRCCRRLSPDVKECSCES